MRYLVVSDIHSNLEALEAVLQSARGEYDAILCCGDFVGYGADPAAVVDWASQFVRMAVRGNHDRVMLASQDLEWFNYAARAAALWTREALSPQQKRYLRSLPAGPQRMEGFQIFHGAPQDEDEYLLDRDSVQLCESFLDCRVSFFGHTHIQGGFRVFRGAVESIAKTPSEARELQMELSGTEFYLINPGSVGQPRDGDPRAAYCIYSPDERAVTFRRIPYNIAAAQRKILAAGLPEILAYRLASGR